MQDWNDSFEHTVGYARGVEDAVAVVNKITNADISVLAVVTELLEQALEDAR